MAESEGKWGTDVHWGALIGKHANWGALIGKHANWGALVGKHANWGALIGKHAKGKQEIDSGGSVCPAPLSTLHAYKRRLVP